MKKRWITKTAIAASLCVVMGAGLLAGCSGGTDEANPSASPDASGSSSASGAITVVSREDGSGTRGAFTELFGLEEENADGSTVDTTTDEAMIVNQTEVVLTQVAGNEGAIGYISLGSLNDSVKALNIDGVEATVENITAGDYAASRPFNIATKKGMSNELATDFINYIMSAEGQQVIEDEGYIKVDTEAAAFEGTQPSGTLAVGGSSSVTPVMEKLAEAYEAVNPNATIEVQQSDSSTGLSSAISGSLDVAMASRELNDEETAELDGIQIAIDGIAVIVNNNNPISDVSSDTITQIYKGEITDWSGVSEG